MTTFTGPDSIFTTIAASQTGAQVPASPTWVGNSFPVSDENMPDGVQVLNVSTDGYAVSGCSWNENVHDGNIYTPAGLCMGWRTCTRNGPGGGGIWGICADSTYIYYVDGQGDVIRSARSDWLNSTYYGTSAWDPGNRTGVSLLTPNGNQLLDCQISGSVLYYLDAGVAQGSMPSSGEVSPTSTTLKNVAGANASAWGAVSTLATVPYARRIAVDREGNLWVLTQGVSGSPSGSNQLRRYNASGTLLSSFTVSAAGYAMDVCCDPSQDLLYVADNGPDQNIKVLNYSGVLQGTVGVKGGYLDTTSGTPGVLGPTRFCGPRCVAIDSSGNLYVAQTGLPQVGQLLWPDLGAGPVVSKLKTDHATEAYRVSAGTWSAPCVPSATWDRVYNRNWSYQNNNGQFGPNPYSYHASPAYTWDDRIGTVDDAYGDPMIVRDDFPGSSHRYLVVPGGRLTALKIYRMDGELANPVVMLNPAIVGPNPVLQLITNGVAVSSAPTNMGILAQCVDPNGNIWIIGGAGATTPIWRFNLQGFDSNGTPLYDFTHVDKWPLPSTWLTSPPSCNIEVHPTGVYISYYLSTDPEKTVSVWDDYKTGGRWLSKWTGFPASGAMLPAPAWTYKFAPPSGYNAFTTTTAQGPHPVGFSVDTTSGMIAIPWLDEFTGNPPHTGISRGMGYVQIINDASAGQTPTVQKLLDPPITGSNWIEAGQFDALPAVLCGNGWVWCEDDWAIKTYGLKLT